MKTLCIDIGGTRIKAAILEDNLDLDTLKTTPVQIIRSLGWLNRTLPELLSKTHPASIFAQRNNLDQYDSISICVPSNVVDNGTKVTGHFVEKRGVPHDLKHAFMNQANCEVVIDNDAVCWLRGAINYCKLSTIPVKFPCLFIALGTGIGLGYSTQINKTENIELSNQKHAYKHLSQISEQLVDSGWKVHVCLGEKYFAWLKNERRDITLQNIKINFTDRLLALILDMNDKKIINLTCLQTIFIGGGNAEYIDDPTLRNKLHKDVFMLTSNKLPINPDLIPLLGQVSIDKQ